MDTYNDLFNTIENYKEMTIEALQYSKIGKGTSIESIGQTEDHLLTPSHEEDCYARRYPTERRAQTH